MFSVRTSATLDLIKRYICKYNESNTMNAKLKPFNTATIPYIKGFFEPIARILLVAVSLTNWLLLYDNC